MSESDATRSFPLMGIVVPKQIVKNAKQAEELLEADLTAVEDYIAAGKLDDAKPLLDRVEANWHRVIHRKTADPSGLLRRIGAAYWALGYPAVAGRYWYLLDESSPQMDEARKEFERSYGDNPARLYEYVATAPISLRKQPHVEATQNRLRDAREELLIDIPSGRRGDRIALVGCALVAFVFLFVFMMGITAIFQGIKLE